MRSNSREMSKKRYTQKREMRAKWTVARETAVLQKMSSAPQTKGEAQTCCFKKRKLQSKIQKNDGWMEDLGGNYSGLSTTCRILYPVLGTML